MVRRLELVTGTGEIVTLTEDTDTFKAAVVSANTHKH